MTKKCPITLYHGTSSFFLDSILKNGLGGVNIIKEWGALDFVNEMLPYVAEKFSNHISFYSFDKMAKQFTSPYSNFQHGNVYLTPSLSKALDYTIKKKYGSELLHYAFLFFNELNAVDKELCRQWRMKYKEIFKLEPFYGSPLIIAISDMDYSDLLDENGDEVSSDKILRIDTILEKMPEIYETALQCENFRLNKVLSKDFFKVYLPVLTNYDVFLPQAQLIELNLK